MESKGKVLVTGANGFLATNAIAALQEAGYNVRGLLRKKSSYIGMEHPSIELMEGDFTDAEFISEAVRGCDFIVHIAAMTGQAGAPKEYMRVNVEATEQLAQAGIAAGIRRMVYVSSANALAHGTMEKPGDETRPTIAPFTESMYAISKATAQKNLRKYADRIEIVTVNPTFMLGPMDVKPSSGRIILMGYGRKIMAAPPGGKNFVHVGDVSQGIVAALTKGRNGEAYLLSGENMDYMSFYRMLSRLSGKKMKIIRIPKPVLLAAGCVCSALHKVGIRTEATLTNMKLLSVGNYYSNAKASRELGITFRTAEEAVKDALQWFRAEGIID